ncbi:hypothetical protein LTR84_001443 [Exophiala bonariae]|uniref:Uncharacterized protein n=1 Tax=Exophiala bonariae TaxID=1690606 RepID=A0AAV9NDH9_9EURO|nr:hypothetical protein LTR84_001443 [Exophiala bonariae]
MASQGNGSQALLIGYLDTNHTSSLEASWVTRPTPWPFVAASVSLSILLGFLGVQTSYKSWESLRQIKSGGSVISMNDIGYQPVRQTSSHEQQHRRWTSASSSNDFSTTRTLIENDAMSTFVNDQRRASSSTYTRHSDSNMHGGLGKFALTTTAIGITWSTIRASLTLALMIQIVMGEKHTYPGIASLVIMFTSVQTYMGSRAMPRILYLLIAIDLLMIYGCIVLAIFSFLQDKKTSYQEFAVLGGNCPCLLGFKTGHDMKTCAEFPSPPAFVGCDTQYLWANNTNHATNMTATYPKSCLLSDHNDGSDSDLNPNLMTYLVLAEIVVGGVGLLYGLIVLGIASRWIPRALSHPRELFVSFPLIAPPRQSNKRPGPNPTDPYNQRPKHHNMPTRAVGMTVLAFVAMLAFATITIVVHVLDETRPIRLFYMDSVGPRLDGAGSIGGNNVVDVGGGNLDLGASWSDCFVVDTPYWADGGFKDWWALHKSNLLRAIALV